MQIAKLHDLAGYHCNQMVKTYNKNVKNHLLRKHVANQTQTL